MTESVSFDRVATRYDATRGYTPTVAAEIANGLMRLGKLHVGSAILEIGIGTGRIALPLLARGVNITGVDISPRMLAQLTAKYAEQRGDPPASGWGSLTTQIADMTALPFADAHFDAVVAVHVLHLVPGWQRALDEALRVIRPGGAFLLGQDVSQPGAPTHQIQDHWHTLITELGASTARPGAQGYDEIADALRARGHTLEEATIASWQSAHSPQSVLTYIGDRVWSQTWSIPDDIFAESMRRLTRWVDERFAGRLDTPQEATYSFKVACVRL